MKRVGNLMPLITHPDNLRESFLLVMRGKAMKHEAQEFRRHLDENLQILARQLNTASYDYTVYRDFKVYEPKQREISAAPFATRVALQAMMRVCHRVFDDYQIYDSYASRRGKGQYKALERAQHFTRRYRWFVKLDVCKFFASVSHEVLSGQLERLFKDKLLLCNFGRLIDGYHTQPERGLPIGNLSSQYFANHYLAVADHYAKEQLRVCAMVRYMDDVVMWGDDKEGLLRQAAAYRAYVRECLQLELHPPIMNRTHCGVPFLGYVVYGYKLRLNQNSRWRLRHKMCTMYRDMEEGYLSEESARIRQTAMLAFACKADCRAFARHIVGGLP